MLFTPVIVMLGNSVGTYYIIASELTCPFPSGEQTPFLCLAAQLVASSSFFQIY